MSFESSEQPVYEPPREVAGRWRGRQSVIGKIAQFLLRLSLLRTGALVAGFLAVLGLLVWMLLYSPKRTPLFAIQSAPYEWPFPPLAWAAEDYADLEALNGKTVTLGGVDRMIRNRKDLINTFNEVAALADSATVGADRPVILYLSMHGIVHEEQAYLVPPSSSKQPYVLNSDQRVPAEWVKVDEFLADATEALPVREKLLVLDCQRISSNWHLGLLENDFSTAVEQLWNRDRNRFKNLSLLCAAGGTERGHTSPELQGSVFGHYFHLGLAGAADKYTSDGARDHQVTLRELDSYLKTAVSGWVRLNRADAQTPLLLTNSPDISLAHTLNDESLDDLMAEASSRIRSAVSATDASLEKLWRSLAELRTVGAYTDEPLAWRELEHKLLWLEDLAVSGSRYGALTARVQNELQSSLTQIDRRLRSPGYKTSLNEQQSLLSGVSGVRYDDLSVRSLCLAEQFDSRKPEAVEAIREQWSQFAQLLSPAQLKRCLRQLDVLDAQGLSNSQFLRIVDRYQSPEVWQQRGRLHRLLELRSSAEQLAAVSQSDRSLSDVRGHYWIRPSLELANESRRVAEDQLFVTGQPELNDNLQSTADQLATAESNMQKLNDALHIRDQALAEAGYLAQWLTHPANRPLATGDADDSAQSLFNGLVSAVRDLNRLINDQAALTMGAQQSSVAAIESAGIRVTESHQALKKRLANAAMRIQSDDNSSNVSKHLREMEGLLACPLLTAVQRQGLKPRLRNNALKICRITSGPLAKNKLPSLGTKAGSEKLLAYSSWLENWQPHPLLALLPPATEPNDSQGLNNRWCRGLSSLVNEIDKAPRFESRDTWGRLEQSVRSIAPVWFAGLKVDPVAELRRLDIHSMLLWHAKETVRDFWGPAGGVTNYFQLAAMDYLKSATLILDGKESLDGSELRNRVSSALAAARDWIRVNANDVVLMEPTDAVSIQLKLDVGANLEELPPGTAAIVVRDDDQLVNSIRYETNNAVDLSTGSKEVKATIPGNPDNVQRSPLDISAIFRGHEMATQLNVSGLGGVVINQNPFDYEPGRVVLHSPWKKLDVVFIFDASQSMNEPMAGWGSRLQVGKKVLGQLLTQLGTRRQVRVGLWMFGHRMGWSTDSPVRPLLSPSFTGEIPDDLTPGGDVEQVLSLSDLDYIAAGRAFERLQSVNEGWGQSPLYLALERALAEEFRSSDAETKKHIIVITDGRNYQFRPEGQERSSLSAVLSAWAGREISIHILGMAMDEYEASQAMPEFSNLTWQTKGSYDNLSSRSVVQSTLQRILGLESYQLEDLAGNLLDHSQLGRALSTQKQPNGEWYNLRYQEQVESLALEGGELMEFYLDSTIQTMLAFPYDNDLETEVRLRRDDDAMSDYILRVHRPIRDERSVEFELSLQRSAGTDAEGKSLWQWTPRPEQVWVEITPVTAQGSKAGQPYHFFDGNYAPEKPVPVLKLTALSWPTSAPRARIRAWIQPSAITTADDLLIAPSPRVVETITVGEAVSVGADIRVETSGQIVENDQQPVYRIRVVERHLSDPSSDGIVGSVGSLKVAVPRAIDLQPSNVTRQFDDRHGVVVHTFDYARVNDRLLAALREASIEVSSRRDAQSSALVADEIVVEISEVGKLIPILDTPITEE